MEKMEGKLDQQLLQAFPARWRFGSY